MSDRQWYEFPSLVLQIKELSGLRDDLREHNLFEAPDVRPDKDLGEPSDSAKRARTTDGTFNDLSDPWMGAAGTGFGRNAPLNKTITHTKKLLDPDPRLISRKLMARDSFKPAGIISTIAAAWLQFENHNWFFHGNGEPDKVIDIPLRDGDDFPVNPMKIRRTIPMNGHEIVDGQPAPPFANAETHWWDGSQVYGTGEDKQSEMRTFKDGKIRVQENGRLYGSAENEGIDQTGFEENYWAGVG